MPNWIEAERGTMVNPDAITAARRLPDGTVVAILAGGRSVKFGGKTADEFWKAIGGPTPSPSTLGDDPDIKAWVEGSDE